MTHWHVQLQIGIRQEVAFIGVREKGGHITQKVKIRIQELILYTVYFKFGILPKIFYILVTNC